jgi:F-box interacting protein
MIFLFKLKVHVEGFYFCAVFRNYTYGTHPLVDFTRKLPLSDSLRRYMYGFGYDRSRDDYVVVIMGYDKNLAYTWKEIEANPFSYMSSLANDIGGTILNEAIHWLACQKDLLVVVIVAFDLTERKLLETRPPNEIDVIPINCGLWVFGEFLGLWIMRVGTVEIWVMEVYQVHSSWTKNIVLPIDTLPTKWFRPIYST